jgi:hypothetical protein
MSFSIDDASETVIVGFFAMFLVFFSTLRQRLDSTEEME